MAIMGNGARAEAGNSQARSRANGQIGLGDATVLNGAGGFSLHGTTINEPPPFSTVFDGFRASGQA
jgi:hypothetical protein